MSSDCAFLCVGACVGAYDVRAREAVRGKAFLYKVWALALYACLVSQIAWGRNFGNVTYNGKHVVVCCAPSVDLMCEQSGVCWSVVGGPAERVDTPFVLQNISRCQYGPCFAFLHSSLQATPLNNSRNYALRMRC